jgi:heme/copper-type cytochrome/quinol oxidase subunit 4
VVNVAGQGAKTRRGLKTILGLSVLTAAEFAAAVTLTTGLFVVLSVIAVVKAWLILEYFMHLSQLWNGQE